jgi:small subunit ribosomal protein S3Ae
MAKTDKKSSKTAVKIKKKRWFAIVSPKFMGDRPIGESLLEEAELAIGRTVKSNLMQLTGDVKSQISEVKFEIESVKDGKLETRIIGYALSPAAVRRFIRRHMTRIDDSLVILTSDGKKVRIKPLLLTRGKVTRSIEQVLRSTLREEVINLVKKTGYENLFLGVVKYSIQKELKEKLNKIYPVKSVEVRVLEEEKRASAKETPLPVKKLSKKVKSKKDDAIEESDEEAKTETPAEAKEAQAEEKKE